MNRGLATRLVAGLLALAWVAIPNGPGIAANAVLSGHGAAIPAIVHAGHDPLREPAVMPEREGARLQTAGSVFTLRDPWLRLHRRGPEAGWRRFVHLASDFPRLRRPPTMRPRRPRLPPPRLRRPPEQRATRKKAAEAPRITPSQALQLAMRETRGGMGLGVELLPGRRPVYAVKLKAGNRVIRVLVDAVTGRIIGR